MNHLKKQLLAYWQNLQPERLLAFWQPKLERVGLWLRPKLERLRVWLRPKLERLRVWWQPKQDQLRIWWQPQNERLRAFWKPQQAKLLARWRSLSQREQYTVLGGGLATAVLLFYALIWSPLSAHLDDLRTRIQTEKKNAAWVQSVDKQLRALEERESKLSVKQLSRRINAVQADLQQAPLGKNLTQLTQSGPDEIRATFDKVPFDELIAWLMTFSQQHQLIVKQADVKRLNNVGLVQAAFVLQVGG